jgi:methyl-accepting chemotaxis protein
MTFKMQLLRIGFVGFLGAFAIGLTSWYSQYVSQNALDVHTRNAIALRNHLVGDMMHDALRGDLQRALWVASENRPEEFASVKSDLENHAEQFRSKVDENKKLNLRPETRAVLDKIDEPLRDYIKAAELHVNLAFTDLARERDQLHEFNEVFSDLEEKMSAVTDKLSAVSTAEAKEMTGQVAIAKWLQVAMIILSGGVSLFLAYRVANQVMLQLGGEPTDSVIAAQRMGAGDYNVNQSLVGASRSSLLGQLEIMRDQLHHSAASAIENYRIKQALDSTSTNVMMADNDRNIIYMNKSVEKMLRDVEASFRKALPHFSVDTVIGSNIDIFHKNPSHQSHLLANLKDTYVGNIVVAGLSFRLIANPIYGEKGERVGSVVEWVDRTAEVALEHEMSRILGALETTTTNVMIADIDRKIIYMNKSVENMLRVAEADIRSVLPHFSVDKIIGSNMDIFHKNPAHQMKLLENLSSTYIGNIVVGLRHFRLVANPIFSKDGVRLGSVVEWLDRTQEVSVEAEVSAVVQAAGQGNFKVRIPTEGKIGFFSVLADGLNSLMQTSEVGLGEVNRVLGAITKGDLTEKITADYSGTFGELKNYCNDTTASLSEIIGDIRVAADTIFTASSEIASGNADLSSRTEQQAANLEETASSMEELTSTVKLNADNAKQANVLAEKASTVAIEGGELIQQVVATMNAINESAQKISDIIGVIDGIAFQTNILALNAAVEAARAGDQGRGFAVVASEVRTLAQRSANAAKDIKGLISDSVSKIENGNALVGKSGNTMKEIVVSIKRVNDIMAEIASASGEQSTGIEEISTAVSQMDEMTQQNAALVEEAAAAAESLQSQADQLTQSVAVFRLADEDARGFKNPSQKLSSSKGVATAPTKKIEKIVPKKLPSSNNQEDEWDSF